MTQTRPTGGFVLSLPDLMLHVDPGPGAIVWANHYGLDLTRLDGVYISHGHTDHFAGAAPVIEAMCRLMMQRRGHILAPPSVFDRHLISDYHRGEAEAVGMYRGGPTPIVLAPGVPVSLGRGTLTPEVAHHGGENLGFVLEHDGLRIGYTSDSDYITAYRDTSGAIRTPGPTGAGELVDFAEVTGYRENMRRAYREVDILVANVGFYHLFAHRHLTAIGLAHLLRGSRIRHCFMVHLGTVYFEPEDRAADLARWVEAASGVRCTVPELGRRYDLGELLGPQ